MLQISNGKWRSLEPLLSQAKFESAFSLLKDAAVYAEQTSGERWEFAVEIESLRAVGLSLNDLRWLVRMQYVQHAREVPQKETDGRRFRAWGDLSFAADTCFIPTEKCLAIAFSIGHNGSPQTREQRVSLGEKSRPEPRPRWNSEVRELWIDQILVKRFKWQAYNQEMILAAFEEEGWPVVIDDPLPPLGEQDPKRRLHDTIRSLNRHQCTAMMRFHGNGTGEGVRWEFFTIDRS